MTQYKEKLHNLQNSSITETLPWEFHIPREAQAWQGVVSGGRWIIQQGFCRNHREFGLNDL